MPGQPSSGERLPERVEGAEGRARPPGPEERALAVGGVTADLGDARVTGAVVLREDAIFLFIERREPRPSLGAGALRALAAWTPGSLGEWVLGAAQPSGDEDKPPPGARPKDEFSAVYDHVLHEAPDIARCRWCLRVPRGAIVSATFHGDGVLALEVPGRDIELSADLGAAGAPGFLTAAGYPVERRRPSARRRLILAAMGALALWAFAREVSDIRQASESAHPSVKAAASSALGREASYRFERDGVRYYAVDGREVPESELSPGERVWYRWREILVYAGLLGGAGWLGFMASRRPE